jgi:multiple sugar transport system permease protein
VNRTERQNLVKGLAFTSPWIIGFCIFTLVPVALSFYYSLCDYTLLQDPHFVGLKNYQLMMGDALFWKSLINTFYFAAISIPSAMLVSLGLAILLNERISGQGIYRTIIFLPSLVPVVASAMLWMWLFNGEFGLINALLAKVGIQGPAWLSAEMVSYGEGPEPTKLYWAMPALAFMSLWGVGHTVTIYLAGLQDVPPDLYEAAEIDGAGPVSRLFNVTLPMLSPVIFFNLIMAIIGTLQVFAIPFIMTGGGPDRSTTFYTMYLYDNAFRFLRMGYASSLAWVQLLIILLLTGFAFWSSRKWVHYQGK